MPVWHCSDQELQHAGRWEVVHPKLSHDDAIAIRGEELSCSNRCQERGRQDAVWTDTFSDTEVAIRLAVFTTTSGASMLRMIHGKPWLLLGKLHRQRRP